MDQVSRFRGTRLFCYWVVFFNMAIFSFDCHSYADRDENKGSLEQGAPFSKEMKMPIFKLKRIVVIVNQFLKLKRLLLDKSSILHLP